MLNYKKKVLFFANIPTEDNKSIGGATVLAKNILEFVKKDENLEIKQKQIRTNWNSKGQIVDYLKWIFKSPFVFYKFNIISIHATNDFTFSVAPIVWIWAKLLNKKIIYHFFGGIFFEKYSKKNKIYRWLIKNTILKSDTVFVETKAMQNSLENLKIKNVVWLPNSRKKIQKKIQKNKAYKKRFVFISRVTKTKGIDVILEASKLLSKNYIIDIYGPLDSNYYSKNHFNSYTNVNYKGTLNSDKVMATLQEYDLLLLPTFYEGEGYPGIIIESLSIGMPVITTKWKNLEEIITNKFNGLLIKPKDNKELLKAILLIDSNNYNLFRENAFKSFEQFSSEKVFKKITNSYLK